MKYKKKAIVLSCFPRQFGGAGGRSLYNYLLGATLLGGDFARGLHCLGGGKLVRRKLCQGARL